VGVALHGNLRDFGIGEVFQLIGQQQKTGVLEVNGPDGRIRFAFDRGAVVWGERAGPYEHAGLGDALVRGGLVPPERMLELERAIQDGQGDLLDGLRNGGDLGETELQQAIDRLTQDTVFTLLRWTQGSFHFTAQPVVGEGDSTGRISAEQILMDGLRMVDEWRTFDVDSMDLDTVWKRVEPFERFRERSAGEPLDRIAYAERIFTLVDGRAPARRIIDLGRRGEFEGALWLSRMRRAGVIAPATPESKPRRVGRSLFSGEGASALAAIGRVVPFGAAALLVGFLSFQGPRHPSLETEGAALAQRAEISFERARLRNAVEAYRFAHGRWPATLAEATASLPGSMASPRAREYYFARRGDSFVVLLPEE
jgi:hypothetical protein